jgi:hypothetical protein
LAEGALELLEKKEPYEADLFLEAAEEEAGKISESVGYNLLHKKVQANKLRCILSELGVRPYTHKSVGKYMLAVQRKYSRFLPRRYDRCFGVLSAATVLGVWLCTGPAILGWIISWKISFGFGLGLLPFLGFLGLMLKRPPKEWASIQLNTYNREVPVHALRIAKAVREQMPHAIIEVEEFATKPVDPFLKITAGGETEYVCVWNEPTFQDQPK